MKLSALLLAASLAGNALLVAVSIGRPSLAPPFVRDFFARHFHYDLVVPAATKPAVVRPAAAAPRPLWTTLGSDDPATLVARLRAAGFPASLIRALVSAEINKRVNARMRAITDPDPNVPFWKIPASPLSDSKRMEEYTQLQRERTKLLRDLFKEDFFASSDATAAQRRQFGELSTAKIDQLQRIEDDYAEMMSAVRAGTRGITLPEDTEKLALLNREKRADLAAILSPAELADYEMRTSQLTNSLRSRLGAFDASEAEFRAIFQAHQALGEKIPSIAALSAGISTQSLQQDLDKLLRPALGDARYADYARESNSDFQQLNRLVERDNLPAATALQAFNLRDSVASESNRIFDDASLDPNQKRAALQALAASARAQLLATLGPVSGPAYVKMADQWLATVERGAAVKFTGSGSMTVVLGDGSTIGFSSGTGATFRRIPPPNPPPAPNPPPR